jgi:hypothetical protein
MQQATKTPVRDELVGIIQGLIDHIDDLSDSCKSCITADTRWCGDHLDRAARVDELEAIDRKLWGAKSDAEAADLVTSQPAAIAAIGEVTGLSEREVTDWLAVAAGTEAAA